MLKKIRFKIRWGESTKWNIASVDKSGKENFKTMWIELAELSLGMSKAYAEFSFYFVLIASIYLWEGWHLYIKIILIT